MKEMTEVDHHSERDSETSQILMRRKVVLDVSKSL